MPRRRSDLSPGPGLGASTASQTRPFASARRRTGGPENLSGAVRSGCAKVGSRGSREPARRGNAFRGRHRRCGGDARGRGGPLGERSRARRRPEQRPGVPGPEKRVGRGTARPRPSQSDCACPTRNRRNAAACAARAALALGVFSRSGGTSTESQRIRAGRAGLGWGRRRIPREGRRFGHSFLLEPQPVSRARAVSWFLVRRRRPSVAADLRSRRDRAHHARADLFSSSFTSLHLCCSDSPCDRGSPAA